jgi:hypothetical protein
LVFNPRETADNLKKSGAFVPGIRPGTGFQCAGNQGAFQAHLNLHRQAHSLSLF